MPCFFRQFSSITLTSQSPRVQKPVIDSSTSQKRIKRLRDKYPSETDGGAPTSTNGDDAQDAKPEAAKTPTKAKTPRTPRKKAAEKKSGKESPTKKRKVKEESADEAETKEEDGSDEQGSDEAE